jgi:hypothetical protein
MLMSEEFKESQETVDPAISDRSDPDEGHQGKYAVGYGKPPEATRFKKGRSGNPRGRKKKKTDRDDLRTTIEAVLEEPVKLRDGEKSRTVSRLEAILRVQRMNALKGDAKAAKAFFKLAQKTGYFSKAERKSLIVLHPPGNPEEQMILKAFEAAEGSLPEQAPDKHGQFESGASRGGKT